MTRIRKGREKDGEESRERSLSGKSLSGFGLQSSQQEELSRFINDKRNPDRERMTLSEEEVERKTCQGRVPKDHADNGRDDRAAAIPSYRQSLFFIAFPPSKLPSPGLPGLYLYKEK